MNVTGFQPHLLSQDEKTAEGGTGKHSWTMWQELQEH